jgi:hypothetical protein
MGADAITTAVGTDLILGDNGTVQMDAEGVNLASVTSTQTDLGGNDVITSTDGNKTVVAGAADDTVTLGSGQHVVAGDNAELSYFGTGTLSLITTSSPTLGGNDRIVTANGFSIVLAGLGDDTVQTGVSNDVMIGDNGFVSLDAAGRLILIESTQPLIGGADSLTSGGGNDVLIGGFGADLMYGGTGNDAMIGDGGRVSYIDGYISVVETIDLFIGNPDLLDGGGGQNVLLGGAGEDITVGNLTNDVLAGDYASATFDAQGKLTSLIRYGGGGPDLISQVQEALYTFRPAGVSSAPVGGSLYDPRSNALFGGAGGSDLFSLSSISGFEYQHHNSSSGRRQQDGSTPNSNSTADSNDILNELPATAAGDEGATPQDGPAIPDGPVQQLGPEVAPTEPAVEAPPSEPAAGSGSDPVIVPPGAKSGGGEESDNLARLDIALAGMLGMQAWQTRPLAAPVQLRAAQPAGSWGSGETGGGRWIHADAAQGKGAEVLLERRARARPGSAARISAGAIEKIAGKWLDGEPGTTHGVEHADYHAGDRAVTRRGIDWDTRFVKDQCGAKTGPAAPKSDK